jgi:hypothetical protein
MHTSRLTTVLTVTYCVAVPRGLHPLRPNSLTVGARRTESADCAPRSSRASPLTGFVGASALQFAGRRRESKRGMHRDRELRNERLVRRQLRQVDVLKAIRIGPRAVIALVIVCRFQRSVRSVSGHRRGSMFSVQTAAHCPGDGPGALQRRGFKPFTHTARGPSAVSRLARAKCHSIARTPCTCNGQYASSSPSR